jgi:hypothetical protein
MTTARESLPGLDIVFLRPGRLPEGYKDLTSKFLPVAYTKNINKGTHHMPAIANSFASRTFLENLGAALWLEAGYEMEKPSNTETSYVTRGQYLEAYTNDSEEEYCTCDECQYQDSAEFEAHYGSEEQISAWCDHMDACTEEGIAA